MIRYKLNELLNNLSIPMYCILLSNAKHKAQRTKQKAESTRKMVSYRMTVLNRIQRIRLLILKPHFMFFFEVQKGFVKFFVVLLALRRFDKIGSWYFGNLLGNNWTCVRLIRRVSTKGRVTSVSRLRWIVVRKVAMGVVRRLRVRSRWILWRKIRIRIHRTTTAIHIISTVVSMYRME